MKKHHTLLPAIRLESLYPKASPEELEQIRERFDRYVQFVCELQESIEADPERQASFDALVVEQDQKRR